MKYFVCLGGTLKIYGESLCRDVPYKTLLLSVRDCAQAVVREMLTKYGLEKADPMHHCLVQVIFQGYNIIILIVLISHTAFKLTPLTIIK